MRYSRSDPAERMYLSSTAVMSSEFVKLIVAVFLLMQEGGVGAKDFDLVEMGKTSIPATLYVIQNNLAYLAISNLDAATYQVTYQGKILTTAILSVIMLNKKLDTTKWIALVMLTAGIALVQLGQVKDDGEESKDIGNPFIGLMAVLCACCTSGLAGVYFEKILKGSPVSVWARNIHLAGIGIISGGVGMIVTGDADTITQQGFFHGYTGITVAVVLVGALGGMVTAVVIKYADNILKGFATSIAIIISCVISIFLFDFVLTVKFVLGTACVNYAVYLYGKPSPVVVAAPTP